MPVHCKSAENAPESPVLSLPTIYDGVTDIKRTLFLSKSIDLWHGVGCDEGQAMKLRLLVEFDPETKWWSAVFPELPGCASAGDTEEEAVRNAREALELWFEPSL